MLAMTLSEIASILGKEISVEREVTSVCTDIEKVTEGCVFVALKEQDSDGHGFVRRAVENGAVAAITEFQIGNMPCITVDNTHKALFDIARYYRKKFSPKVVGVTGSIGKTTTKEMIYLVLSSEYNTIVGESIRNQNTVSVVNTVFDIDDKTEAAVFELGMTRFGEINRQSSVVKPTIAVITNIGFSHIENLGSQEGILKAKLEILNGMDTDSPIILNADDEFLSKEALDRPVITYGVENETADVNIVNIETNVNSSFDIIYKGESYRVKLSCYGIHNIYNAAAAFTVGVTLGIAPEKVAEKLSEYEVTGLRQKVDNINGIIFVVDCDEASPSSMKSAINALKNMRPVGNGKRVAVLADMKGLGEVSRKLHEEIGEYVVKSGIDKLICYGHDAKFIAAKADELGLHSGCTSDKLMLIEYLKKKLEKDDIVLFKGSREMKLEDIIDELCREEKDNMEED